MANKIEFYKGLQNDGEWGRVIVEEYEYTNVNLLYKGYFENGDDLIEAYDLVRGEEKSLII